MKDDYDFSNAEQGKFYIPVEQIELPIYLDKDLVLCLEKKYQESHESLQIMVHKLLRRAIENDSITTP
jgi:hypothetical protein